MTRPFEPLLKGRSSIAQQDGVLEIAIPPPRSFVVEFFLVVWLVLWSIGGYLAVGVLIWGNPDAKAQSSGKLFLFFWLCMWVWGEVYVLRQLVWTFFGIERIWLDMQALRTKKSVFGLGKTRVYELTEVKRLRMVAAPANVLTGENESAPMTAGCIAFDYGRGTVSIAPSIDAGEATAIVEELYKFSPSLSSTLQA